MMHQNPNLIYDAEYVHAHDCLQCALRPHEQRWVLVPSRLRMEALASGGTTRRFVGLVSGPISIGGVGITP